MIQVCPTEMGPDPTSGLFQDKMEERQQATQKTKRVGIR